MPKTPKSKSAKGLHDPVILTTPPRVSTRVEDMIRDPDPGNYFIESPGAGGVPASTRLSPEVMAQVQEIVQSGRFPFNSINKLLRTSVSYFIEKALGHKMDKVFQADLQVAAARQRLLNATTRVFGVMKFVEDTAHALNKLCGADLRDEAINEWYNINRMISNMSEPYASTYRDAFNSTKCVEWTIVREELGLRMAGEEEPFSPTTLTTKR